MDLMILLGAAMFLVGMFFMRVSIRHARNTSSTEKNDTTVGYLFTIGLFTSIIGVVIVLINR